MDGSDEKGGKRERNRVATRQRVADAALQLFEERGYDATTLEEVARVAGISPRTLFHYFRTKDELVDFWRTPDFDDALAAALREGCDGKRPLEVLQCCLTDLVDRYDSAQGIRIDRLLNSTESLRLRKQQVFLNWESVAFAGLSEGYASRLSADDLWTASMIGIGALRLALTRRRQSVAPKPLVTYLEEQFSMIACLIGQ